MIKRPNTPQAYVDLVKQALFEIDELRAAIEYDMEGMQDSVSFVDDLERAVKQVYESMVDGSYHFQDKDLPFMDIVRQQGVFSLPFRDLLNLINDTHRKGLEVDEGT